MDKLSNISHFSVRYPFAEASFQIIWNIEHAHKLVNSLSEFITIIVFLWFFFFLFWFLDILIHLFFLALFVKVLSFEEHLHEFHWACLLQFLVTFLGFFAKVLPLVLSSLCKSRKHLLSLSKKILWEWVLSFLSRFEWLLTFFVDHHENSVWSLFWGFEFEEWVRMRDFFFTFGTKIKIFADWAFIANTRDWTYSTAITDKSFVNNLALVFVFFDILERSKWFKWNIVVFFENLSDMNSNLRDDFSEFLVKSFIKFVLNPFFFLFPPLFLLLLAFLFPLFAFFAFCFLPMLFHLFKALFHFLLIFIGFFISFFFFWLFLVFFLLDFWLNFLLDHFWLELNLNDF